jgi:hypothetical protein
MPTILALGSLRQEDPEFKDRLGYNASSLQACAPQWDPTLENGVKQV